MKLRHRRHLRTVAKHVRALTLTLRFTQGLPARPNPAQVMAAHIYNTSQQVGFARRFLCSAPPSKEELQLRNELSALSNKIARLPRSRRVKRLQLTVAHEKTRICLNRITRQRLIPPSQGTKMGILYYAVNRELKEAFALGKNSFYTVNENKETLSLKDRVALQYADNSNFSREDTDEIADALSRYEPFEVIPDYRREDPAFKDFVITGSRFTDDSEVGTRFCQD